MLRSLQVEGFRGLAALTVEPLARVNLFVGVNQSGKTSLLDAIQLVIDRGSGRAFFECQERRGELLVVRQHADGGAETAPRLDALFRGGSLKPGARFAIRARDEADAPVEIEVEVVGRQPPPSERRARPLPAWAEAWSHLALRVSIHGEETARLLPVPYNTRTARRFLGDGLPAEDGSDDDLLVHSSPSIDFIAVAGLEDWRLNDLWGEVVLTPREEPLLRALRLVEPALERMSLIPSPYAEGTGELMIKIRGCEERLRLGDMGEGFRRMLGLLLCLPDTPRSEVLVDEIDTGLHYSVLRPMWRTILEVARERDLQVFATTHSWDCVAALGKLFEDDPTCAAEIALHRIDPGYERTAHYAAEAICTAAQHHIEVRG